MDFNFVPPAHPIHEADVEENRVHVRDAYPVTDEEAHSFAPTCDRRRQPLLEHQPTQPRVRQSQHRVKSTRTVRRKKSLAKCTIVLCTVLSIVFFALYLNALKKTSDEPGAGMPTLAPAPAPTSAPSPAPFPAPQFCYDFNDRRVLERRAVTLDSWDPSCVSGPLYNLAMIHTGDRILDYTQHQFVNFFGGPQTSVDGTPYANLHTSVPETGVVFFFECNLTRSIGARDLSIDSLVSANGTASRLHFDYNMWTVEPNIQTWSVLMKSSNTNDEYVRLDTRTHETRRFTDEARPWREAGYDIAHILRNNASNVHIRFELGETHNFLYATTSEAGLAVDNVCFYNHDQVPIPPPVVPEPAIQPPATVGNHTDCQFSFDMDDFRSRPFQRQALRFKGQHVTKNLYGPVERSMPFVMSPGEIEPIVIAHPGHGRPSYPYSFHLTQYDYVFGVGGLMLVQTIVHTFNPFAFWREFENETIAAVKCNDTGALEVVLGDDLATEYFPATTCLVKFVLSGHPSMGWNGAEIELGGSGGSRFGTNYLPIGSVFTMSTTASLDIAAGQDLSVVLLDKGIIPTDVSFQILDARQGNAQLYASPTFDTKAVGYEFVSIQCDPQGSGTILPQGISTPPPTPQPTLPPVSLDMPAPTRFPPDTVLEATCERYDEFGDLLNNTPGALFLPTYGVLPQCTLDDSGIYGWTLATGGSNSPDTGPGLVHGGTPGTLPEDNVFIITEASFPAQRGETSVMTCGPYDFSAQVSANDELVFSFDYYMYGANITYLQAELCSSSTSATAPDHCEYAAALYGQQQTNDSQPWLTSSVAVPQSLLDGGAALYYRFSSACGADYQGDVAVDNVCFGINQLN